MTERIVAIHQPNFFPWLGWFHKVARADVFVLLDDVEFSRGSWINRTRVLVNGEPIWMTVPVLRGESQGEISTTRINESTPWRKKALKTLEHAYRRSQWFDDVYPIVAPLLDNPTDSLAAYNEAALRGVAEELGLDGRLVASSSLPSTGSATERLVSLVGAVGGTAYLSGRGAAGYQRDELFEQAGIKLLYTDFAAGPYEQPVPEFVPGLSVIDALMNCGFERTRHLVEGRRSG